MFDEEYYLFNRALDYEYDVEAFDTYMKRAEKSKGINDQIEWYQKAADLVHGVYLSDINADWVTNERVRLEKAYNTALDGLARLYLNANELEKCISICQTGININPYNEALYQISMRAYAVMGDRAAIARLYQACKTALDDGHGLLPSLETETLFRELAV